MKRLSIRELRPGMVLEEDVYSSYNGIIPLLRKNTKVTATFLTQLEKRGVIEVFVKDSREAEIARRGSSLDVPERQVYVPKAKPILNEALKTDALGSLEELFTSISFQEADVHASSAKIIRNLDSVVGQLVDTLTTDRNALVNINDLKSYDDYTYHHSLSVAVLSIAIGQYMNLSNSELNALGKCAMMHDIGKTAVPVEIINKPSRLSDEELLTVKSHSASGYEYLIMQSIGDEELQKGVRGHHEKYDGTGYPDGLREDGIPSWSRIISVADVYDALTSNRPYRTPMQPAEAIEYIMGGVGSSFDYDMVDAFVRKVELYPIGECVELSLGKDAIVLNNENHMRPVVRIMDTGEILDLYRDRSCLSIVVNRLIPDEEIRARRQKAAR